MKTEKYCYGCGSRSHIFYHPREEKNYYSYKQSKLKWKETERKISPAFQKCMQIEKLHFHYFDNTLAPSPC